MHPAKENLQFLWPIKDDVALKTWPFSPCECGKVYVGQTGQFFEAIVKDHHHHKWLYYLDKLS
jgi:hypothetical protein